MADRKPLFTAQPLPRADIKDPVPEESDHPQSLTGRIRKFVLTDPEPLFTAKARQVEHERKVAEADAQDRDG